MMKGCHTREGMARLHDIVVDCKHPASLARFWAQVLEGYAVAPYDDAELARLREHGIDDPEDDTSVMLESAADHRICFQLVPEPKTAKNRVHLDLRTGDLEAEVDRLVALGATVLRRDADGVTLADPQENEFCVFPD